MLEQAAGELAPNETLAVAREMIRDRRLLTLEGGRMTTLAVRAQEQAIERRATQLAQPAGRDVSDVARDNAALEVAERVGGPLSPEQHHALEVLTGPERAAVLIGPAGTGKGVMIDAAARAEQHAGHETIGVAVSGSTAERLGADSPALAGQTLTGGGQLLRAVCSTSDSLAGSARPSRPSSVTRSPSCVVPFTTKLGGSLLLASDSDVVDVVLIVLAMVEGGPGAGRLAVEPQPASTNAANTDMMLRVRLIFWSRA